MSVDPVEATPEPPAVRPFDAPRVEAAVRELLEAIGEDADRDGLKDAEAGRALVCGNFRRAAPDGAGDLSTTFAIGHDELVVVKDIPLYSVCEHHLVPFHGVAHVGYIPGEDGRITGLSKIARLVEMYARRPQVQERMTTQIADAMARILAPRGVIVVIECEHLCMAMRGIRKPGSTTVTSAVRGQLRDSATRAEAMSLIRGR